VSSHASGVEADVTADLLQHRASQRPACPAIATDALDPLGCALC
jgi:hypothetical protein